MSREVEELIRRAMPLLFGVFGHSIGDDENRIVRAGGSGIFVAQFLALTARHVTKDFFRLDERRESPPKHLYETNYGVSLYQLHDPFGGRPKPLTATWQTHYVWESQVTDISLLQAAPEPGHELALHVKMPTRFFDWSLLPPRAGSRVTMLGFPKTEVSGGVDEWTIAGGFVLQEAEVQEVYEFERDRGMLTFPCFRVNMPADYGFSGGPVFHEGRLCGVVSAGPSWEDHTYVASLWPLCLMEYDAGLGGRRPFADLVQNGTIVAADWHDVRGRFETRYDESGKPKAFLAPPSA